MYLFYDIIII